MTPRRLPWTGLGPSLVAAGPNTPRAEGGGAGVGGDPDAGRDADGLPGAVLQCLPALIDGALPPIALFAGDGRRVYANRAFRDLCSEPGDPDAAALAGLFRTLVLDREDRGGEPAPGRPTADAGSRETPAGRILRFRDHDYQIELAPLPDPPAGDPLVMVMLREVTTLTRALDQARQAQARLQDFVECSSNWVWEADETGVLTSLSMRLTQMVGRPAQIFVGCRFGDIGRFVHPALEDLSDCKEFRLRLPFRNFEFEMTDRSGTVRQQSISGVPVFDRESGRFTGYRGTGADVSDEVAAKRALTASQHELRVALDALWQRNAELSSSFKTAEAANRAKSTFLANMSHELRTPLNAILGFAEVLKTELLGPIGSERYRSYSQDIHSSANHLLELITDILDLSTVEAGRRNLEPARVDLLEEARYALRLVEGKAAAKNLRIAIDRRADDTAVTADRRAVRQMLTNLLTNAVKFTLSEGRVTIEIAPCGRGQGLAVTVRDTGVGIPAEDLERITRPFERSDQGYARSQEGSGLGLALTKSLIELHDGRLIIDSRLGEGTAATLTFPPDPPLAAPGEAAAE
jgi:signal transduction histidine kinase